MAQDSGQAKLDFWDVVRVDEACPWPEVRGRLGYVAGIGEEEGNPRRSIGVWIYDLERVWSLEEEDLLAQGHKDDIARADYERRARGPHLRVRVDPLTGEGDIVD